MRRLLTVPCLCVWLALAATTIRPAAQASEVVVSAASSLGDVMTELSRRYEKSSGVQVRLNVASSSTLARQIVEGAPVDVFMSADQAQMEVAERSGRLAPGTRFNLLTNQLALIVARVDAAATPWPEALATSAVRRIAMANPASVPAGVYGRQWLERLNLWARIAPKVVPLSTVRAALASVREGRAEAAIVYATDARVAPELTVAYLVPADHAPPIIYPVAVVQGPREAGARALVAHLRTADARIVFEGAGFGVLPAED